MIIQAGKKKRTVFYHQIYNLKALLLKNNEEYISRTKGYRERILYKAIK